jgi:uncharacterized membrane protein YkoI
MIRKGDNIMRKKLLVSIIAVLALVFAVGCGNNEPAPQQPSEPQAVEQGVAVNEDGLIGEEKAKQLALARVEGASSEHLWDFDLDRDDGRMEYEGEIRYNGMEYEFEIDAKSGEFIKWNSEKEYD